MDTVANTRKNDLTLHVLRVFSAIYASLLLSMASSTAWAESNYQVDWEPNKYKVVCQAQGNCMLSGGTYRKVERLAIEAAAAIKAMGFKPPFNFGMRVGKGTSDDLIEIYDQSHKKDYVDSIASTNLTCSSSNEPSGYLQLGGKIEKYADRDYLVHYILAHELFHLVQFNYPFRSVFGCNELVPGWVMEGIATAVALETMRGHYFTKESTGRDDQEARLFSGLRRYDTTLADRRLVEDDHGFKEVWTGGHYQYRTSSFWRHLANVYYKGKYGFLKNFMSLEVRDGDWLGWLWNNIKLDTDENLSLVHAGFLVDFAGWGDPGFPGQFYGRKDWLKKAFGGCQLINLDKTDAVDYVDVKIEPLGGKCIDVRISGVGENGVKVGDSASVQVAAMILSGSDQSRDGLHLGLAVSNDKDRFHCAREVKHSRKQGLGRCLRIPDDGKIRLNGGEVDARVWNVIPQEKGKKEGALSNLYTVSYAPLLLTSFENQYVTDPITARFYFVLDVTEAEAKDPTTASIGAKKEAAIAHLAEGGDPQTTLPKQDERGMPANSYSLPESLRPRVPVAPLGSLGHAGVGKLGQIIVSQGEAAAVTLFPVRERAAGKYEPHALGVGDTGEFLINLVGSLNGEPLIGTAVGSLNIEEFSDLVLRARYSGTLCRLKEMKPNKPCPNPVSASGRIVKAFVGTRLPGRHMKIERTAGTEIYRKANEKGMAAWSTTITGPATPGTGTSTPESSTGSGGSIPDCACTCEEREATIRAGDEIKQREAAGEKLEIGDIMSLNRCSLACQREYMICAMEQGDRERAARKERRKAERAEAEKDCDCSCTALQNLEARTAEILGQMQSGNQTAMQKMQALGQCMSVCQDELMRCSRSR